MPDFRGLTLKQLRALASTVSQGTVTAAAKDLHVTPPAITTQLKTLERGIGAPIFDRTADGFVPTEIGQELLDAFVNIDKRLKLAENRIAALKSGASGSVVVGVVSTGKYFAPAIVAAFQKAYPDIRVTLSIGNREAIITGLEQDEFDVAIMGRPPVDIPLTAAVLCDHPHVLIAAPEHPLAHDPEIQAEELCRERFLARERGSGTRMLMEKFIERISGGVRVEIVEMGTNETIKQAVMAGLGIAIISAHTCHAELIDGKLVALSFVGLPLIRQWFVIQRAGQPASKAAEVFRAFVLEHQAELVPRI